MQTKEYTASLDKLSKGVTVAIILLLTFSAVLVSWTATQDHEQRHLIVAAITAPLLILTLIFSYLYAPKKYLLTDKQLIVVRPIGQAEFDLSDITEMEQWNTMGPGATIRTFGVGGLFGYFGYYYNSTRGKLRFYCTTLGRKILITTGSKGKIVISPDDENMLVELNKRRNH